MSRYIINYIACTLLSEDGQSRKRIGVNAEYLYTRLFPEAIKRDLDTINAWVEECAKRFGLRQDEDYFFSECLDPESILFDVAAALCVSLYYSPYGRVSPVYDEMRRTFIRQD